MNNNQNHIKVIIAGGGTGGHIFPAVAIANALKHQDEATDILFVGALGKMEMEKVPQEGYPIVGLEIAGFNRSNMLKNLLLPFKVIKSLIQANRIFKTFKPQVVIGVGGYASFPMLYLAQRKGIPTLIQEQNSHAGKTNKILGKKAAAICVAYAGMDKFFPKSRIIHTGNPVRKLISQSRITHADGLTAFGLGTQRPSVLVVGGSQGAKSINEAIAAAIPYFVQQGIQLIWQTGKAFYETAVTAVAGHTDLIKVHDFIRNMDYAYAAADVVISRAGALAIAELCLVGKPVIFVPFPFAAEDHQTHNAMALVDHNAALMVRDVDVKQELANKLQHLFADEKMQQILADNIKDFGIADADDKIATEVRKLVTG
jgi:UDP-N-acetylglucosamine--N-acetylmuramyl-(pentapeptide) pyrophosphoryl-undecaprenol N-acetylglucosamine transferase